MQVRRFMSHGVAAVLAALACAASPAGAQDRPPLPSAGIALPGANDRSCPGPPVVLVHGTRADMTINWPYFTQRLRADGFCPWAVDLPDRGQAPMGQSARVVADFIDGVRGATGARRVSLIGHSQGGLLGRHVARFLGGTKALEDVIAMGTPQYGYYSEPPFDEVDRLFNTSCPACYEMAQGSDYLNALNAGDPTPGQQVAYTQIITTGDQIATPVPNQYLPVERGVVNITLQEVCPGHQVDHLGLAVDDLAYRWARQALRLRGPADPAEPVAC